MCVGAFLRVVAMRHTRIEPYNKEEEKTEERKVYQKKGYREEGIEVVKDVWDET